MLSGCYKLPKSESLEERWTLPDLRDKNVILINRCVRLGDTIILMEHTASYCVKLTNNVERANGAENENCVKAKKRFIGFVFL